MRNLQKIIEKFDNLKEKDRLYFGKWHEEFEYIYLLIRDADINRDPSSLESARVQLFDINTQMNKLDAEAEIAIIAAKRGVIEAKIAKDL